MSSQLHLFADVGGTFTDCLFWEPPATGYPGRGTFTIKKILSSGILVHEVGKTQFRNQIKLREFNWKNLNSLVGYSLSIVDRSGKQFNTRISSSIDNKIVVMNAPLPEDMCHDDQQLTAHISSNESSVITALRCFSNTPLNMTLPDVHIRYATTAGTNALLERKGKATAFITTSGFEDLLKIGYQERPSLFSLNITKTPPLYRDTAGLSERINSRGQIISPLDEIDATHILKSLKKDGIESIAICLLNSWVNPDHEIKAGEIAVKVGFKHVFLSHETSPLIRLVPRSDTTVIDAFLSPVINQHLSEIVQKLTGKSTLCLMTSAGGLSDASRFKGRHSLLSGPAGGMVSLKKMQYHCKNLPVIGFDMGGTSTDVSRFDHYFDYRLETDVNGIRVATPMLNIETVASGGGSICHLQGQHLKVGPESAGADPGPAAYGRGGPFTLTDANIILGYVPRFPFPLSIETAEKKLFEINSELQKKTNTHLSSHELATGFRTIACETMAASIRKISMARGFDLSKHALCAFGGAGPQHACQMADLLHIDTIVIHPLASVQSAFGLSIAPVKIIQEKPVLEICRSKLFDEWEWQFKDMETNAEDQLLTQQTQPDSIRHRRMIDLRYLGQTHTLTVEIESFTELETLFNNAHTDFYGYAHPERTIEVTAFRLETTGKIPSPSLPVFKSVTSNVIPRFYHTIFYQNKHIQVPVYYREDLKPGHCVSGPSLIAGANTSIVIEPNWSASIDNNLVIVLKRCKENNLSKDFQDNSPLSFNPIILEVLQNRFAAIAEEMGVVLQKSALSTNVKERLDFSCAVFDHSGQIIANAPHIPVHLGAMGETVRAIAEIFPVMSPGDVYLTNDPYYGGSHLPDLTVVMPVFDFQNQLIFYCASRAHHAEIGGITPGSMASSARNLSEEGVVIEPLKLCSNHKFHEDRIREILTSGPFPSRAPDDNISDLMAQVAACKRGEKLLLTLLTEYDKELLKTSVKRILDISRSEIHELLDQLIDKPLQFTDFMDDGSQISVSVTKEQDTVTFNFEGTSPPHDSNLNANSAIVRSAVMYCLRCMINRDIPLNEGVLNAVRLIIPESILSPPWSKLPENRFAMAGGNVETSQRVCDVILGALDLIAASQGTMNNITFGTSSGSYYETVGGGSGAGHGFNGTDGVQVNMTNTRITDPEVIERRYGIELVKFSIRKHSGGPGRYKGGNGLIREYRFTESGVISILSERRKYAPFGLHGGGHGAIGINTMIRADGTQSIVPGKVDLQVQAGDVFRLETPGGGGWGKK